MSADCKYQVVKLDFEIGTELFSASSKLVTDPGFSESMPWLGIPAEERLPDLHPNQSLSIAEVILFSVFQNCVFLLLHNSVGQGYCAPHISTWLLDGVWADLKNGRTWNRNCNNVVMLYSMYVTFFYFQDASIPVHIANISQRNYVEVTGGRKLVPSNLGICLVHGYKKVW